MPAVTPARSTVPPRQVRERAARATSTTGVARARGRLPICRMMACSMLLRPNRAPLRRLPMRRYRSTQRRRAALASRQRGDGRIRWILRRSMSVFLVFALRSCHFWLVWHTAVGFSKRHGNKSTRCSSAFKEGLQVWFVVSRHRGSENQACSYRGTYAAALQHVKGCLWGGMLASRRLKKPQAVVCCSVATKAACLASASRQPKKASWTPVLVALCRVSSANSCPKTGLTRWGCDEPHSLGCCLAGCFLSWASRRHGGRIGTPSFSQKSGLAGTVILAWRTAAVQACARAHITSAQGKVRHAPGRGGIACRGRRAPFRCYRCGV